MVNIKKEGDNFIFNVKGMHKFWAFKSELTIAAKDIRKVHRDFSGIGWWKGWRIPGTQIPFLITAGTFFLHEDKIFWDVMNQENSIIVEVDNEEYDKLIIEVENPGEAIRLLTAK